MAGLKVNFSQEEASSEAMDFDPLPTGKYHVKITDVELRESKSEKNAGKPYWNLEMTVQDGPYENRKLWGNVMLFEGALYSLGQLAKALGMEDEIIKKGNVPDGDDLISRDLIVTVKKQRNTYLEEKNGDGEPVWSSEVKGYKKYEEGAVSTSGKSSILP